MRIHLPPSPVRPGGCGKLAPVFSRKGFIGWGMAFAGLFRSRGAAAQADVTLQPGRVKLFDFWMSVGFFMKGPQQLFQDRFWTDGLKVAEGFVRICTHRISLVLLVYAGICVYIYVYIYIYTCI